MHTRLKMSREGLELLKEFEGLRLAAAQLPDGRWTMGHGHTEYAREGATITASDAEALLVYDLIPVAAAVNDGVMPQISQNQFDALTCFAFNVGVEAFQQSEVLQRVNQERMTEAALAMAIWRSGAFDGRRVVLDALVRRRTAEEALLLGRDAPAMANDLIQPEIDPAAQTSLPAEVIIDAGSVSSDPEPQTEPETTSEPEHDPAPPVEMPEVPSIVGPAVEAPEEVTVAEPVSTGIAAQSEPEIVEAPASDAPVADAVEAVSPVEVGPPDAVHAGSEPIVYTAPDPQHARSIPSASLSTRVFTTYLPEPMRPDYSAMPQVHSQASPVIVSTPAEAETSGSAAPSQVLILTPPPEISAELPPTLLVDDSQAGGDVEQAGLFGSDPDRPVGDDVVYYEPEAEPEDRTARWSDVGAYVATGAVGLAAFGFGIAGFQLAGQDPVPNGMFDEKTAISWVLVGIGVVCVWIAAYNLFKRLGGTEELG